MSVPDPALIADDSALSAITRIADGRARVDEIDGTLRDLITARQRISRRIQELRMVDGGPRVEHNREREVLAAWSDELGPIGADVARALLILCRGSVSSV